MAQNMMTPLATSLLQFQLKKMFKNMVCILGLFGLATVLATFQKILGDFFSNSSGHPARCLRLLVTNVRSKLAFVLVRPIQLSSMSLRFLISPK